MRLLSALVSSVLLGLACMSVAAWSRNRFLPVGLMVALTPTALWLGAMVNPSGLEIAAAICLWCSGLVLALERMDDPPGALVATVAVAAAVLTLTRGLSPLWTVLILATLIVMAGPAAAWRLLRQRRDVQVAAGALVAVAAAAVAWIVAVDALAIGGHAYIPPPGWSPSRIVAVAFGQTESWLVQMVGLLGWNDTAVPLATNLAWAVAIGTLLILAVGVGRSSESALVGGLVVAVLVIPVVLTYIDIRKAGFVWVGRYTLPLAVGIPLMTAAMIGRADLPACLVRRLAGILLIMLGAAGFLGFAEALRRYAVGVNGPLDFLLHGWAPIEGTATALVWYLAATAVLTVMLWRLVDAKPMSEVGI